MIEIGYRSRLEMPLSWFPYLIVIKFMTQFKIKVRLSQVSELKRFLAKERPVKQKKKKIVKMRRVKRSY